MITVGVPVLNNYSGLYTLLGDINNSSYKDIEKVIIINNGTETVKKDGYVFPIEVYSFGFNVGVASSWNKILNFSSGIRFIVNDDMRLEVRALENIANSLDINSVCFPVPNTQLNSFSFFTITDEVISKVGLFDETISPNYAYFEDNDYHRRMGLAGVELKAIPCGIDEMVIHDGSKTLRNMSTLERDSHHKKFNIARKNYVRKWGGMPGKEVFNTPHNT